MELPHGTHWRFGDRSSGCTLAERSSRSPSAPLPDLVGCSGVEFNGQLRAGPNLHRVEVSGAQNLPFLERHVGPPMAAFAPTAGVRSTALLTLRT